MKSLSESGTFYTEVFDEKSNAFIYGFQSITTFFSKLR